MRDPLLEPVPSELSRPHMAADGLAPCPTVAALIARCTQLAEAWANELAVDGKMFGVLVCDGPDGLVWLKAYSGMLGGRWEAAGYCPPIWDASARATWFDETQASLARLTVQLNELERSVAWHEARRHVKAMLEANPLASLREELSQHKADRRNVRSSLAPCHCMGCPTCLTRHELDESSRADKRRWRSAVADWNAALAVSNAVVDRFSRRHAAALRLRRAISRMAFARIARTTWLTSFAGHRKSLAEFFPHSPPSGAGDCAAPKLLNAAALRGLAPLALAEFWLGAPTHQYEPGRLYSPCAEKCQPLLAHYETATWSRRLLPVLAQQPTIVFEDEDIMVIIKPAGLLSVPGRRQQPNAEALLHARAAHRLDEDTSGLLVLAKHETALRALRRQFALREVGKRYEAVVEGLIDGEGTITLPLRLDIYARPRQVVDIHAGKVAHTRYAVVGHEGARTRLALWPTTGRTHQLRVHTADHRGLGAPIVGDRLYGCPGPRLLLHASEVRLRHPTTRNPLVFSAPAPF